MAGSPNVGASYPVLVHRLALLLHASFGPSVAGTPLRFANPSPPSGWVEDFHFRAAGHAQHTSKTAPLLARLSMIHYHGRFLYESPELHPQRLMPIRIAVLGAGNMGAALIGGILNRVAPATHVIATTRTSERAEALAARYGITVTDGGNREAAEQSDLIVLAVKPGTLPKVVAEIRDVLSDQKILLSL